MKTDKLDLSSPDLVNQNIEKIAALFPNCVTETAEGKAIDFDLLKQELNHEVVEGAKERYRLEWPGKKEAIVTANLPTTKTLRPVREDSVDFDTTENMYIEGDNLEVLKILQESYLGKIKMIYIDPPYNTGKDFVYKDNFTQDSADYKEETDQTDEYGNRLVANPETAGRYHSDWLSMMYPRLKLARNLLTDDGVIFMSIDDNEVHNLRKISDEVFGESNFVAAITIITGANQAGEGVNIQKNTETCLVYCKSYDKLKINRVDKVVSSFRNLNDAPSPLETRKDMGYSVYYNYKTGDFFPVFDYDKESIHKNTLDEVYVDNIDLINKGYIPLRPGVRNGKLHRWRWGFDTFKERKNEIVIEEYKDSFKVGFIQDGYNPPKNYLNYGGGTSEVKSLFNGINYFDYPKSVKYLQYLTSIGTVNNEDVILDFFSGSGTTAQAVLQLNAEDGGNRKFIMAQLPEATDEKSEAYKAGYNNICEIGKERIRRASAKIKEDTDADIDYGFKVFKVASSNMQDVYYKPQDYNQGQLDVFADNIKEDRTAEDLLTQILLDWGLPLTLKTQKETVLGKEVFIVDANYLLACFDNGLDEVFAKEIAKHQPLRFVCKDSSFKNDTAKENVKQLLKQLSPNTEMKVI
ncbi:site-specific DNA-methyltransferase [Tenacibaculum insulae]|uniref:site-specific DNA-methyltransferase n=1 Tax=Tenacibaculum insulae TaxID=2029677 RepID=UPI003AB693D0